MIISTRGTEYYVIRTLDGKPDRFVCKDASGDSAERFHVLRLPIREAGADLIRYLMSQVKNENFREFVDYTTDGSYLYVVTSFRPATDFMEMDAEDPLKFAERLTIGLNCLEHIFTSDIPEYFVHEALREGHFDVAETLDVRFQFDLKDIENFSGFGVKEVSEDFAAVLSNLFARELDLKCFPDMEEFIRSLQQGSYKTMLDIYREYKNIFVLWKDKSDEELKEESPSEKMKRTIDKIIEVLKGLVVYAILLVALGYLVMSIIRFNEPYEQEKVYDKIGDEFIEYVETEAAE